MAYDAFLTDGTQFKVKIGASFVLIPGAQGIDGPTGTKTQKEYTALDDTAAKFKAGRPDYGEVSWDMMWDPTNAAHQHLKLSYDTAGSVDDFEITLPVTAPNGAKVEFSGSVTGFKINLAQGDFGKASVTVKVSGSVDVTVTP